MKIRLNFVSNSSSSSFIIRGEKIKTETLIKLFKINMKENKYGNDPTHIDSFVCGKLPDDLDAQTIRSYFDGKEAGEIIVGKYLEYEGEGGEDGVVSEVKDPDDEKIIKKLNEYGIEVKKLKTYFQYISNDNY